MWGFSNDCEYLSSFETEVAGDWITGLDSHQLILLEFAAF